MSKFTVLITDTENLWTREFKFANVCVTFDDQTGAVYIVGKKEPVKLKNQAKPKKSIKRRKK